MKKSVILFVLSLATLASCGGNNTPAASSSQATTSGAKSDVKIGLITLHDSQSTYDKNFIDGMVEAANEEGVTLLQKNNIGENTACYDAAAELADNGCSGVFADSFGHEKYVIQAAEEFPNVQFGHATGTQAKSQGQANYHNAFASIYEGRYLAGVAAGMKLQEMDAAGKITAKNKDEAGNVLIGYVGAYTYAEVISGYTSFYLGVKSVYEKVAMQVTFTGSWYSETGEKTAAETLISNGCALISQHADSMGAPTACESNNIPNVSYNGSTASQCPETFIVSSRINWTPYFKYMIESIKDGKSYDTDWCGTITNGSVELTDFGKNAASGTAEKVATVKAELVAGTRHVFDTSTFTVTVTDEKNTGATVDANGHLTSYVTNINGKDVNVVSDGYFHESDVTNYRSAPYFDVQIDGITLLDVHY